MGTKTDNDFSIRPRAEAAISASFIVNSLSRAYYNRSALWRCRAFGRINWHDTDNGHVISGQYIRFARVVGG
jgi:hypothetical protein